MQPVDIVVTYADGTEQAAKCWPRYCTRLVNGASHAFGWSERDMATLRWPQYERVYSEGFKDLAISAQWPGFVIYGLMRSVFSARKVRLVGE